MIYLYIKTHNITGLKYLGKTCQDPHKYRGSGKRWLAHIKKHGYDVTTEIVGAFDTIDELQKVSIPLSSKLNIVESSVWANLRPEAGDGGDTSAHIDYSSLNRGKGLTYEQRYGKDKAEQLRRMRSEQFSKNRKGRSWDDIFGKEYSDVRRKKLSDRQKASRGSRSTSDQTKAKLRAKALGRSPASCCCVVCKRIVPTNNITQHFGKHHPLKEKSQQ